MRNFDEKRGLNYITLLIFAPLLVLAGTLGFVLPETILSGAPAYNLFHLFFGLLGIACVASKSDLLIRIFNGGFGLIDLYQAAASFLDLFPEEYFQWKVGDDLLHLILGFLLFTIAISKRE